MQYSVKWRFPGGEETQQYDDKEIAQQDMVERAEAYAREYGRCESSIVDGEGQTISVRVVGYD